MFLCVFLSIFGLSTALSFACLLVRLSGSSTSGWPWTRRHGSAERLTTHQGLWKIPTTPVGVPGGAGGGGVLPAIVSWVHVFYVRFRTPTPKLFKHCSLDSLPGTMPRKCPRTSLTWQIPLVEEDALGTLWISNKYGMGQGGAIQEAQKNFLRSKCASTGGRMKMEPFVLLALFPLYSNFWRNSRPICLARPVVVL